MSTKEVSKILVTTGEYHGYTKSYTELIDMNGNCSATLPNYPKNTCWATGIFINGIALICGGYGGYDTDDDNGNYKVKSKWIFQ